MPRYSIVQSALMLPSGGCAHPSLWMSPAAVSQAATMGMFTLKRYVMQADAAVCVLIEKLYVQLYQVLVGSLVIEITIVCCVLHEYVESSRRRQGLRRIDDLRAHEVWSSGVWKNGTTGLAQSDHI